MGPGRARVGQTHFAAEHQFAAKPAIIQKSPHQHQGCRKGRKPSIGKLAILQWLHLAAELHADRQGGIAGFAALFAQAHAAGEERLSFAQPHRRGGFGRWRRGCWFGRGRWGRCGLGCRGWRGCCSSSLAALRHTRGCTGVRGRYKGRSRTRRYFRRRSSAHRIGGWFRASRRHRCCSGIRGRH